MYLSMIRFTKCRSFLAVVHWVSPCTCLSKIA
ncbi:Uncharacterised protein [Vibrio cholerae]|nr:Uncharacterised protein [Vibrio cholerae]